MSFNTYPNPQIPTPASADTVGQTLHANATGQGAAETLVFDPETGQLVPQQTAAPGSFQAAAINKNGFYHGTTTGL
eukprot:CAMPEP_0119130858 /NCGR_PEP_ID=MMETSP1310-20130426/9004_1 /TAXON_ID=464262 /ORGANISM="Genus nov. species nov., Strain RCC2339" /LENGTH=75 /DNA_ID=CAMNT_0007121397 /DNA_START=108 /DNA_END=335 /DNA_ORIENTATION=+